MALHSNLLNIEIAIMIIKHGDGRATFILDQISESPVFLVGDFNNWSHTADPMELKDNKWKITKLLSQGAFQFKYVVYDVDGEHWYNDWRADAYVKSPFGGENSVIIIE